MDNYIMIGGKRIDLTPEQVEKLTEKPERDNFDRVKGDSYFFMDDYLETQSHYEAFDNADDCLYGIGNYHKAKETMQQWALKVQLMLLLLRFQEQNGGDAEWDGEKKHFRMAHCKSVNCIERIRAYQSPVEIYFKDSETAERAYEEVVKPFLAQHPEFVW